MSHAVYTGPIRKDLTLSDGSVVDVRPDVVHVDTEAQRDELLDLIGRHYAETGHPAHDDGAPFTYETPEG